MQYSCTSVNQSSVPITRVYVGDLVSAVWPPTRILPGNAPRRKSVRYKKSVACSSVWLNSTEKSTNATINSYYWNTDNNSCRKGREDIRRFGLCCPYCKLLLREPMQTDPCGRFATLRRLLSSDFKVR